MILKIKLSCFAIIFCSMSQFAMSQQVKKLIKITGDVGLYGDFYHMESDTIGAVAPRRPSTLMRMVVNTSIDIKDFSMPISMALPTGQYGTMLPSPPTIPNAPFTNFKLLIKNPLNRVGIAPKYKWVQVLLGSQVPRYSELSVGDLAIFGSGVNLTPGKFRFSYFGGTSQLAVERDSAKNIQGIYSRKIYAAKVGLGHEDSSHIYIIGSMMQDDTSSVRTKPLNIMPQTGIVSTIDFRLNFGKKVYIKGEIAGSGFTRDIRSKILPPLSPPIPNDIYIPKESSRFDYASILHLGADWKKFGIKTIGRYYGDGFVPLGYPFFQSDRLEVTIDPRLTLFKNKFLLTGSIGRRINNLSGIRAATSIQSIGSANLNIQFSDKFSISGSYSNFGFRNTIINDTFRVQMITNSWNISPSYNYSTKKSLHNFSIMYSKNTFNDYNPISGILNNNDAINGVVSYMLSRLNNPFIFNTMISYFNNITSNGRLLSKSVNMNLGYKFFKSKLSATAGLTGAENKINESSSGFQIMTLLGVKCAFKKKFNFALNISQNIFKYGTSRPGIGYKENLLRTSLTYKL